MRRRSIRTDQPSAVTGAPTSNPRRQIDSVSCYEGHRASVTGDCDSEWIATETRVLPGPSAVVASAQPVRPTGHEGRTVCRRGETDHRVKVWRSERGPGAATVLALDQSGGRDRQQASAGRPVNCDRQEYVLAINLLEVEPGILALPKATRRESQMPCLRIRRR